MSPGNSGPSVTKKLTLEDWKSIPEEKEFQQTVDKIKYITKFTGKWNRSVKVLEIQCGLGSMPQFMQDNGFAGFHGTDNNEYVHELWDDHENLTLVEPDDTGFEDKEFHLVCWFSMDDGRIEEERFSKILDEMHRVGHGAIVLKKRGNHLDDFLAFMMDEGWSCDHSEKGMYLFHK